MKAEPLVGLAMGTHGPGRHALEDPSGPLPILFVPRGLGVCGAKGCACPPSPTSLSVVCSGHLRTPQPSVVKGVWPLPQVCWRTCVTRCPGEGKGGCLQGWGVDMKAGASTDLSVGREQGQAAGFASSSEAATGSATLPRSPRRWHRCIAWESNNLGPNM